MTTIKFAQRFGVGSYIPRCNMQGMPQKQRGKNLLHRSVEHERRNQRYIQRCFVAAVYQFMQTVNEIYDAVLLNHDPFARSCRSRSVNDICEIRRNIYRCQWTVISIIF
ncbi:hypothetical protein D3C77_297980 [compost metagenome]